MPQGGNTGLVGGQTPHHGEVVLSLKRLDRIREVDAASNTMTCEAGVVLANAQEAAAAADRLFPLSLGAEGSCTIGGNLSTNAGGTGALAYGVARELALGLEVVLADGRILRNLRKLKKDNTGYDLRNLFIGAEGTLGIITAAMLKLFPHAARGRDRLRRPAVAAGRAQAASISPRAGRPARVTSFELIPRIALDFACATAPGCRDPLDDQHPWYVLMELSSQARRRLRATLEEILAQAPSRASSTDAAIAASLEQRAGVLAAARRDVDGAEAGGRLDQARHLGAGGGGAGFHRRGRAPRSRPDPGRRPVPFGHLGDGNIHYNVSQPIGADTRRLSRPLARGQCGGVRHRAADGGSISAEHGIGVLKRDLLPGVKDPVALEPDAQPQAHARPQRHPQSGQGVVGIVGCGA